LRDRVPLRHFERSGTCLLDHDGVLERVGRADVGRVLGIGEGPDQQGHVEVEDAGGVERIPVHPDDVLRVDRARRSPMVELAESALLHPSTEVEVGLGAREVVDGDERRRVLGARRRDRSRDEGQREVARRRPLHFGAPLATPSSSSISSSRALFLLATQRR
jgi:hypothetical protein